MKTYTQQDFDALVRDANGCLHCPTGDWTGVQFRGEHKIIFACGCTLGNGCKLGEWCTLGNECMMEGGRIQNATFFFVSNIGSENRTAYAYCDVKTGEIFVRAGCWFGGVDAFEQRVRYVHAGTHHETDYLAFAQFARARFARYGQSVEEAEQ